MISNVVKKHGVGPGLFNKTEDTVKAHCETGQVNL